MKNKLSDLNNHLFAQLERLSDEEIKGEVLQEEIKRAGAIVSISSIIIENAKTCIMGYKVAAEYNFQNESLLQNILTDNTNK